MNRFAGELDFILLSAVRERLVSVRATVQPAVDLIIGYLFVFEADLDGDIVERVSTRFRSDISSDAEEKREGALYFVADVLRSSTDEDAARALASQFLVHCAGQVGWGYWHGRISEEAAMPTLRFSRRNLAEWAFLRCTRLAAELDNTGQPTIVLDLDRLYSDLYEVRRPKIVVAGREMPDPSRRRTLRFSLSAISEGVKQSERRYIVDVLRRGVDARVGS